MNLFACQSCRQPLYFENRHCTSCERRLGYLPTAHAVTALEREGREWRPLARPDLLVRFCANADHDACNWLIAAGSGERFCIACRHNRIIPDLSSPRSWDRWRRLEAAKRRLFYTLLKLRLPLATRAEDPQGLVFDFLADPAEGTGGGPTVLTGHDNGLITLNIAEADDVERERQRSAMGEPYRTLLGHFRHEIAHYYWNVLVQGDRSIERFRTVFGDEREDYGAALGRHYASGPPAAWQTSFVSAYASAHPWEDFAETWAHYLHIVDTLETANAFGMRVQPQLVAGQAPPPDLTARIDFDPHGNGELGRLIEAWLPLTFAVNSLNRSMGQPDLYPFVLSPTVIGKLGFVHERIHAGAGGRIQDTALSDDVLKAVIASLRQRVAAPHPD